MNDLENDGKKWTWEEPLIAFDLYSRIPYSKISGSNTDVIKTIIGKHGIRDLQNR